MNLCYTGARFVRPGRRAPPAQHVIATVTARPPSSDSNPRESSERLSPAAPSATTHLLAAQGDPFCLEMLHSVQEVLFRTNDDGHLSFLNDYWHVLSGFNVAQSLNRPLTDFLHPDDRARAQAAFEQLLAGTLREWADELRLRTLGGEIRWVGVSGRLVSATDTAPAWIAGTIDDISSRKIAELTLRNLNQELEARVRARTAELEAANRELEAFSYSVSHDLRAPLRAIDGFSRILADETGELLDARQREHLGRIRKAAERMAILIDALIGLATLTRQPLQRETVDLSQLAESVIRDLHAEDPARTVDVVITRGLSVNADPALMHVLLDNLLRNAWKFCAAAAAPRIAFRAEREGSRTVFCVEDNGAGLDMRYAERLFEPFTRLHASEDYPGTGIGLATVKRIVTRHEGRIWVDAHPGEGARFHFTLGH